MTRTSTPRFDSLTDEECRALLERSNVGRLAFTLHDKVDIQPLNYALDGNWIVGRTEIGAKLAMIAHNPWCAFEVDEVRGMLDWDSVVVRGMFQFLDPESDSSRYDRALDLLRALIPGALGPDDPAPQRNIVFAVHLSEVSGRSARPG